MSFAPDGRIFISEQGGALRVIKDGALLATPFLTAPGISAAGERGLLGIAFDPDFATNNFVYVYYTHNNGSQNFNRLSRFTANGDTAVAGSEVVLMNLDPLTGATNHNGTVARSTSVRTGNSTSGQARTRTPRTRRR